MEKKSTHPPKSFFFSFVETKCESRFHLKRIIKLGKWSTIPTPITELPRENVLCKNKRTPLVTKMRGKQILQNININTSLKYGRKRKNVEFSLYSAVCMNTIMNGIPFYQMRLFYLLLGKLCLSIDRDFHASRLLFKSIFKTSAGHGWTCNWRLQPGIQ